MSISRGSQSLVAMLAGLSPHDLLVLGWKHLDLDAGELRVERTLDTKSGQLTDATKRESRMRTVPLAPRAAHEASGALARSGQPPPEGLAFAGPSGLPLGLDHLRTGSFKAALRAAEISRAVRGDLRPSGRDSRQRHWRAA